MGFLEGQFPFTNLGVPIVDDRLKIRHLDPLIERGEKKLAGWKNRLLSQRGKTYLAKACAFKHAYTSSFSSTSAKSDFEEVK